MKFTTVFSTILAAASSLVNADGAAGEEFPFFLANAVGGPGPAGLLVVNLTAVTGTASAMSAQNISRDDVSNQYSHALTDMFSQIPAYVEAIHASEGCDEQCCEDACMILIWIPGASMLCIECCKIAWGYA
ncbi:hypothetical protein QBC37DRAFT_406643 [Rhypophila decipiens]|uniref:Uncharacterized protein n=1 Tax=Rhypophila decipiens TaxID=261697 RepID=A0AAN6XU71_9PEZI|nr:hypothetical protein QBC37DRAFT_406643 [Rhypophila decipiens]